MMRHQYTDELTLVMPRVNVGLRWGNDLQHPSALWIRISRVDLDFAVVVFLLLLVLLERTESVGQIRRRKAALFDYFEYVRLSTSSSQHSTSH